MTIVQSADPETGLEGDKVSSVTPRSKSIGFEGDMDPLEDGELVDEMDPGKEVLDDLSPEAGLRYTPVNTKPNRFEDDGYALRAAGAPEKTWGKLSSRQIKAFALVTCYNEGGEFLRRTLSAYAKNIFMLQQVFGEKVWEEMPVSVIIDGKGEASQSMLDYCANELQLFSPEVMAISSLGLEVQMHLFERTIFMPKVDNIPMPPMHVILGLKEKNAGKLDSHAWFFEAFCEPLQPKYVILIDVGTVATETAVFRVLRSMDRNSQIAAVHAEPTVMSPSFCSLTVAAQNYEYKVTNIMDRSVGSLFGFIDLLPGCFVAYRFGAVKTKEHPVTGMPEGPLVNYFQPLTTPVDQLGPFLGNMHLAEGRVLCFEILARWNEKWTMHYCKGAVARTDVPDSIPALIRQRKRWLNGTFFASLYTLFQYPRILRETKHNPIRKFFFFFEWMFIGVGLFMTWFLISNLYLIMYYIWQQGLTYALSPDFSTDGFDFPGYKVGRFEDQEIRDILLLLSLIYLSVLICQFLVALGNRPEDVSMMYKLSAGYFGSMILFCLLLQVVPLFRGHIWLLGSANCDVRGPNYTMEFGGGAAGSGPASAEDRANWPSGPQLEGWNADTNARPFYWEGYVADTTGPDGIVYTDGDGVPADSDYMQQFASQGDDDGMCMSSFLEPPGYIPGQPLTLRECRKDRNNKPFCEPCEEQQGAIMWTLIVVVGIYLVAALIQGELHQVIASVFQYFLMMPTFINILSVYAFSNLQDLSWGTKGKEKASAGFKARKKGRGSISNFIEREKIAREEEKARRKQAKALDSQFATFRSLVLCLWITSNFWWANIWFYEDPGGFCYLYYVGWFIVAIAILKLVGSLFFMLLRTCRGIGERIGICQRPYKYEAGHTDRPVVPKGAYKPPNPDSVGARGDQKESEQGSATVLQ